MGCSIVHNKQSKADHAYQVDNPVAICFPVGIEENEIVGQGIAISKEVTAVCGMNCYDVVQLAVSEVARCEARFVRRSVDGIDVSTNMAGSTREPNRRVSV
jgi:hypothetical protein